MRNKKAIVLLFTANAVSGIAQGMSMIAVPLYFNKIVDQQPLWFYSLALVFLLGLFWRLYAGALVDGFRRKDVFLGTNFFAGLIVFAVAALGFAVEGGYTEGFIYANKSEQLGAMFGHYNASGTMDGFLYDVQEGFSGKLGLIFGQLESGAINNADIYAGITGENGMALGPQLPTVLPILIFATTLFAYFIHFPNLYAFVQEIEDQKSYSKLTRLIEIIGQVTAMGAGAVTAILMGGKLFAWEFDPWQIHHVFLLNGVTYVVSFIIILFIKYEVSEDEKQKAQADQAVTVGESLKIGLAYLRKHPIVFVFGLLSSAIFISYMTMLWSIIQTYVTNHLYVPHAEQTISLVELYLGLGALLCALFIKYLFDDMSIPKVIFILTILISACFFALAFTQNVVILFIVTVVIGFTNAGSRIYRVLYLFGEVPNRLIGRVQSIINIPQTLIPVAFLFIFGSSYFVEEGRVIYSFLILGAFTLINALLVLVIYKKVTKS